MSPTEQAIVTLEVINVKTPTSFACWGFMDVPSIIHMLTVYIQL